MTPDEERREILIVCGVVGATVFIVANIVYFSLVDIDWTHTKDVFDVLESGVTVAAIVLGGIWTYYNFIRGRIYAPRIELQVSGRVIKSGGVSYLVADALVKNVGITRVNIGGATALLVYSYMLETEAAAELNNALINLLAVPQVFVEHAWITPGTTISDQRLFVIPPDEKLAFRIQLRVVYNNKKVDGRGDNQEANSGVIVEYPPELAAEELTIHVDGRLTYG